MRAYIPNSESNFDYPEDMSKILDYLNKNGQLNVQPNTVEALYREFSDRYSAGWMCVNDDLLEEFANWLSEVEI